MTDTVLLSDTQTAARLPWLPLAAEIAALLADPAVQVPARLVQPLPGGGSLFVMPALDGRIATATGESRWITGPAARRHVHALRLTHDAVLTATGTALADDPDLTARDIGAGHQPLRILLDSRLRHAPDSRLGRGAATSPVWVLHGPAAPAAARAAWAATGARLIETPADATGHIDLPAAFRRLAAEGLTRILIEAGATFAAALIRQRLVDDLALFTAGLVLGGDGHPALAPLGLPTLADAPRLHLRDQRQDGPDTFTLWSL